MTLVTCLASKDLARLTIFYVYHDSVVPILQLEDLFQVIYSNSVSLEYLPILKWTEGTGVFKGLSHHIKEESGESLAHQYLLQRLLVAVQQENAAGHIITK